MTFLWSWREGLITDIELIEKSEALHERYVLVLLITLELKFLNRFTSLWCVYSFTVDPNCVIEVRISTFSIIPVYWRPLAYIFFPSYISKTEMLKQRIETEEVSGIFRSGWVHHKQRHIDDRQHQAHNGESLHDLEIQNWAFSNVDRCFR